MKQYRITLERTVRATRWFEAAGDEEAVDVARLMHNRMNDSDYEDGESDSEYDYALMCEDGRDVLYFNN